MFEENFPLGRRWPDGRADCIQYCSTHCDHQRADGDSNRFGLTLLKETKTESNSKSGQKKFTESAPLSNLGLTKGGQTLLLQRSNVKTLRE